MLGRERALPEGATESAPLPGGFISPDEPIRRRHAVFLDDAFMPTDEPLRPRRDADSGEDPDTLDAGEELDVEVTGIGEPDPEYYAALGRSEPLGVVQIAQIMEELARQLREDGPAALLVSSGASSFESVLRGYVAGYLTRGEER